MKHCTVYKMEECRRNEGTALVEIASLTHHLQILFGDAPFSSHRQVPQSPPPVHCILATRTVGNAVFPQKTTLPDICVVVAVVVVTSCCGESAVESPAGKCSTCITLFCNMLLGSSSTPRTLETNHANNTTVVMGNEKYNLRTNITKQK